MWISMPELIRILGKDAALSMAAAMGGTRVYVPSKADEAHRLAEIVGLRGMRALCAEFCGMVITVPNARREALKEKAVTLLGQGKAPQEIVRECGVTLRYIRYLASLESGTDSGRPPCR